MLLCTVHACLPLAPSPLYGVDRMQHPLPHSPQGRLPRPRRPFPARGLFPQARGQAHKLYRKMCARYLAPQEPQYDGGEDGL